MFSYSNMSLFNLAIKLNSWLFPRIAIRFNYYRILYITYNNPPHVYYHSRNRYGSFAFRSILNAHCETITDTNSRKKRQMHTKINFEASSILLHFFWNWNFNDLFRGLDAFNLQYLYVLRSDDLNIQVPRASPLIKTD